jgi:arylsulfatase A-like enzyme
VFENTLILFLSDNGGSNEGGVHGSNTKPGVPGTQDSHVFYGSCWANASNAPFRLYKKWVHEGGIATPLIAHWPAGIRHGGTLTDEVGHVIDIMATCADVGGAEYPKAFNGQEIPPLEGLSLAPVFRTGKRDGHDALCWAHAGNFAVRSGKWKLVSEAGGQWELFDIDADRTELHDLAARFPDKVKTLAEKWEAWAGQHAIPRPVPSP